MDISFERTKSGKDEWLTPRFIVEALGPFDLDPCSPIERPWSTAKKHYTLLDDGLSQQWDGRVWCNPPYGAETGKWLKKMAKHNNGIALIFARTETKNFFDFVWDKAKAIMFLKGRLSFYHVNGIKAQNSAGAPSCLLAYGDGSAHKLEDSGIDGKFLWLAQDQEHDRPTN
jgi:hypothetical protein